LKLREYAVFARHDTMDDGGDAWKDAWYLLGVYAGRYRSEAKENAPRDEAHVMWKQRIEESPGSVQMDAVANWNPKPVGLKPQTGPRFAF
jgi:hypothetical protein